MSLEGTVEKAEGVLPTLISAEKLGSKQIYFHYNPLIRIYMLEGLDCVVVQHIEEVINYLGGQRNLLFIPIPEQTEAIF